MELRLANWAAVLALVALGAPVAYGETPAADPNAPELTAPPAPAVRAAQDTEVPAPELVTPPAPAMRPEGQAPAPRKDGARPQFTITLAGDTGFSPHMAPVNPRTSTKGGRTLTFEQAFEPISKDVNGEQPALIGIPSRHFTEHRPTR